MIRTFNDTDGISLLNFCHSTISGATPKSGTLPYFLICLYQFLDGCNLPSRLRGYKTFFMLNSSNHEISAAHKAEMLKIFFLAFKLSDVVYIMLINVTMPTKSDANNCWHFNIYEHDKFHAQLS